MKVIRKVARADALSDKGSRLGARLALDKKLLRQQQVVVAGVLGSISLAVLVFALSSARAFSHGEFNLSPHVYYALLVTLIGGISATCIMSGFALSGEAGGIEDAPAVGRFGAICLGLGLIGTLVALPLLVLPFTVLGSIALSALEVALTIGFVYAFIQANR